MKKYIILFIFLLLCSCSVQKSYPPEYLIKFNNCTGIAMSHTLVVAPYHCVQNIRWGVTLHNQKIDDLKLVYVDLYNDIALYKTELILINKLPKIGKKKEENILGIYYGNCPYSVLTTGRVVVINKDIEYMKIYPANRIFAVKLSYGQFNLLNATKERFCVGDSGGILLNKYGELEGMGIAVPISDSTVVASVSINIILEAIKEYENSQ